MSATNRENNATGPFLLPKRGVRRIVVFAVLIVAAFALRAYKVPQPPLRYHATRQYRSALIARARYLRGVDEVAPWKRAVALSNLASEPRIELPVMEYLAVAGYRILGRESLGGARLIATVFWLLGAGAVYGIARRIASRDAALIAVTFYLFARTGVVASRAFLRDPLMVVLMLAAIYLLVLHFERPAMSRLVLAGVAAGASILVKPLGFFPIMAAYVGLTMWRGKRLSSLVSVRSVVFVALAVLPAAAHTLYGMFVEGALQAQAGRSFIPSLLLRRSFWHGWLYQASMNLSYATLLGSLVCLVISRNGLYRACVLSLWVGYVVCGLVFAVGVSTHGYYQLMLVPIVALSLTPLTDVVIERLRRVPSQRLATAVAWILLGLGVGACAERIVWERDTFAYGRTLRVREEIGEKVNHSTKTIILDIAYGKVLKYHGFVDGDWWPTTGDLEFARLRGLPELTAAERLDQKLSRHAADFFIIGDLGLYRQQREIQALLTRRYPVFAEGEGYIIFDLRERLDQELPEPS